MVIRTATRRMIRRRGCEANHAATGHKLVNLIVELLATLGCRWSRGRYDFYPNHFRNYQAVAVESIALGIIGYCICMSLVNSRIGLMFPLTVQFM